MSKFNLPSVSDSFNSSKNRPDPSPNGMNPKQMLFYFALVIAGAVTFGIIMHYSNKRLIMLAIDTKKDNKQPLAQDNTKDEKQLPTIPKQETNPDQIIGEADNKKPNEVA